MRFASGEPDGTVCIVDTGHDELASFRDHDAPVTALAASRNGALLVSGAGDGRVVLRDLTRGEVGVTLVVSGAVSTVAVDEAGWWIAAVTAEGLAVHDVGEGVTRHHAQREVTACAVAAGRGTAGYRDIAPAEAVVAVGDRNGDVSIGRVV